MDTKSVSQAPSFGGRSRGTFVELMRSIGRLVVPATARPAVRRAQNHLINAITFGRGLKRRLPGGETIRVSPLANGLSWNLQEYYAFRVATKPATTILDIGANAGAYSLLFGGWVGTGGRVIAFEPSPATQVNLRRHIALNGLEKIVELVPVAISDQCSEADFTTNAPDGMHRLTTGSSSNTTVRVQVTTLDAFCRERQIHPSVIKIDVEGFELAVLRGARETLRRVGDGLEVFMEIHPSLWPEIGVSQKEISSELETQGLDVVSLGEGEAAWSTEGICLRLRRVR